NASPKIVTYQRWNTVPAISCITAAALPLQSQSHELFVPVWRPKSQDWRGVRSFRPRLLELDEHVGELGEGLDGRPAALPPDAGGLVAAERRGRGHGQIGVHPHRARAQGGGDAVGRVEVAGPDAAGQAEL